ncbi:GNAT family N-acetyltransferase [Yoonia sp. 208BN28-4]|uniref:GNAT family N-acetyltransferase n=1 Tax=Yoonia sp. 208BN28-4 TaxID=3126505 RepID=UPI003099647C
MTPELARPSDLPAILKLIRALSAFHGDTATVTLGQLQDAFFGPAKRSTAIVMRDGPNITGYAGLNHTLSLHTGVARIDIHHLFVCETHRGRGIGKAVIAYAKTIGRDAGARGLTIGTDPKNIAAQSAYRAMGLEEITDSGPRFWIPLEDQ